MEPLGILDHPQHDAAHHGKRQQPRAGNAREAPQRVARPSAEQERRTHQRCTCLQHKTDRNHRQHYSCKCLDPAAITHPCRHGQGQRTEQPDTGIDHVFHARRQNPYTPAKAEFARLVAIRGAGINVEANDPEQRPTERFRAEELRIEQTADNEHKQRHVEDVLIELAIPGHRCRHQEPQQKHHPGPAQFVRKQPCATLLDQEHQPRQRNKRVENIVGPLRRRHQHIAEQEYDHCRSEVLPAYRALLTYLFKHPSIPIQPVVQ